MARSRIEGLLASFPKLADSSTQHTTVEQDNVRYVYQPLDELYMVLITNRQSNILQDIDSLHLFAQVVTSICKSLDEREILRNAFELLSAFDELVTLGYRENLSLTQIKTFLEMESHEERIQEIISRVRFALNLEFWSTYSFLIRIKSSKLPRSERGKRNSLNFNGKKCQGRGGAPCHALRLTLRILHLHVLPGSALMIAMSKRRTSHSSRHDVISKMRSLMTCRTTAPKGKGMQLGKKSKTTDMFERVRGDLGAQSEDMAPLVSNSQPVATADKAPSARVSSSVDREAIHATIDEQISARLSRDGMLKSFNVKGNLLLRISDPSMTKVKLDLIANQSHGAQFKTHPNVDKPQFNKSKAIQLKDPSKGFPANNSVGVLRWSATATAAADTTGVLPITFTVWVNKGSDDTFTITVEYEMTGSDSLQDVVITIPYSTSEPAISTFDAQYEVSGDSLEWTIGTVDEGNSSGTFEFEAQAEDEAEFFPMSVRFAKSKPFIEVDVSLSSSKNFLISAKTATRSRTSLLWRWIKAYPLPRMSNPSRIHI